MSTNHQLIGISLFTGAGGLDIGMERAGIVPRLAMDIEKDCIETLTANKAAGTQVTSENSYSFLQDADIINADICSVDGRDFRSFNRRRVDCVYGGPPCQSFSSSGKMGSISDPRGLLVFEFSRFIEEVRPRTFVMENVRGLVTARCSGGQPGGVLSQLIERFASAGYATTVGVLNSADYGSFQRRQRCFVIGVDSGTAPPFPMPTHASAKYRDYTPLFPEQLPKWRSLREFLNEHRDDEKANWVRPTAELAKQLASVPEGCGLKSRGVVETTRPGGHWGYRQGTFIADTNLPARTVTGSASQDWVRLSDGSLRRLTFNEIARLQGFPVSWKFAGTKRSQFQQVGNAVPAILLTVAPPTNPFIA